MDMKGFLYGQTEYNLLKNTIHLDDYIQTAKDNGFIMAEDMQHIWQAEDYMVAFCYNANFKLNKFTNW